MNFKNNNEARNFDSHTVAGFGDEWQRFTQNELDQEEKERIFQEYFAIFPWHLLPDGGGQGVDVGCGSGRWATMVARRVKVLHCIDASSVALEVAKSNLSVFDNIQFQCTSVDAMPFPAGSLDFAYSLGVLHHVPDTQAAICSIAGKLKRGAPFLLYLYYAFDNRPLWYRWLWRTTELGRHWISRLPGPPRYFISQIIAVSIYWPLARLAKILAGIGCLPVAWPLAYYRNKSFYVMRTDALDRFGTRLEQRFTRIQIEEMLKNAGFLGIRFSDAPPYWCALGIKA